MIRHTQHTTPKPSPLAGKVAPAQPVPEEVEEVESKNPAFPSLRAQSQQGGRITGTQFGLQIRHVSAISLLIVAIQHVEPLHPWPM